MSNFPTPNISGFFVTKIKHSTHILVSTTSFQLNLTHSKSLVGKEQSFLCFYFICSTIFFKIPSLLAVAAFTVTIALKRPF